MGTAKRTARPVAPHKSLERSRLSIRLWAGTEPTVTASNTKDAITDLPAGPLSLPAVRRVPTSRIAPFFPVLLQHDDFCFFQQGDAYFSIRRKIDPSAQTDYDPAPQTVAASPTEQSDASARWPWYVASFW